MTQNKNKMFNNPLKKYQSGETAPSQEQQELLAAFVEWLPKRVKQFANMAPEQIVETLNGMSQTPEGQKQVESLMQQFQQEMQSASPSQFEKGGKLWNFICKHAEGGRIVGCGCKEDGGEIKKSAKGNSNIGEAPVYYYNEKGYPVEINSITTRPGRMLYKEEATPIGKVAYLFNDMQRNLPENAQLNFPIEYNVHTVSFLDDPERSMGIQPLTNIDRNNFQRLKNQWTPEMENGGNIEKDAKGNKVSRKEALQAAQERRGFSKEQAQRAYANAKYGLRNAGLHGSELRQAARKMLIGPMEQEAVASVPTEPIAASQVTITAPAMGLAGSRPVRANNYDNMSFSNAFRAAANIADKGGDKTFSWKGKTYGTRRNANWRERWGKEFTKTPIVPDINTVETPNGTIELPIFEEIPVNTPQVEQIPLSAAYPFYILDGAQTFIDPAFYGSNLMSGGFNDSYHRVYNPGANGRVIREHTSAIASRPYVGQKMTLANTGETTPNGEVKLPQLALFPRIAEEEIELPEFEPIFNQAILWHPVLNGWPYPKKEDGGIIKGQGGIGKAGKAIMKSTSKARIPSSTATLGKNLGQSVRNIAKPSKVDYDIDKIISTVDNNTYIEPFKFTFPKFENIEPIDFSKYSAKDLMHNPPTITDRFINWAKGRYTPKSEADWAKYKLGTGIGAAAGAVGASILAKNSQNK